MRPTEHSRRLAWRPEGRRYAVVLRLAPGDPNRRLPPHTLSPGPRSLEIACQPIDEEQLLRFRGHPMPRFCGVCGRSFSEASKSGRPPNPRSYTPKHLADKILAVFTVRSNAVHRVEATINQFTGDCIMGLIRASIAREDGAATACGARVPRDLRLYAEEP